MPHFTYELCNRSKNVPWPTWMPSECRKWVACEPQQSATSVHAKATRPRLRVRSSAFLAAISLHFRALSLAP
ncbi:Os03g0178150, partial [Oryza sativa Japonica Group]